MEYLSFYFQTLINRFEPVMRLSLPFAALCSRRSGTLGTQVWQSTRQNGTGPVQPANWSQ